MTTTNAAPVFTSELSIELTMRLPNIAVLRVLESNVWVK